jgi:branched-chain amino acid transport system permease protein
MNTPRTSTKFSLWNQALANGKHRIYWLMVLLCLLPFFIYSPYYIHILIMLFFYAFLAIAWNIIGGYGGQLSLGHSVFYGVGAYTSTLLFVHFNLSPWMGMLVGGLLATLVSVAIGYPCFRLHGPFFSMSTLAILEVFRIMTVYFSDLTEGSVGVSIPLKFGLRNLIFEDKKAYLYIMLGLFFLAIFISRWIERSKFGYHLVALREDEDAAESAGVNVSRTKLKALMISAFLTSIAGTFHAQYALYIDPSGEFSMSLSVLMAIMVILGGAGTLLGPILGAVILVPLQEALRAWFGGSLQGLHLFIYGLLLIIAVLFLPNGILAWLKGWISRWFPKAPEIAPEAGEIQKRLDSIISGWTLNTQGAGAENFLVMKIRNLGKSFGGVTAVKNVDVDVKPGEVTGLIGPNGAGKTTFFNLISGIFRPDSGEVVYLGANITGLTPAHKVCRKGIGRTFQIVKPFGNISVLENVMIGAFAHVRSEREAREIALAVLDFIGLYPRRSQLAKGLTLGDRKRLELGRALATKPRLLLLDEIMAGLNPSEIEEAIALIQKIKKLGVTIILIEHVMQAVMNLSDQVIILHHGEKIAEGPPRQIATDEKVIKAYLGEEYVMP